MHHAKLKAAVTKYKDTPAPELEASLMTDDKQFTSEEVAEIIDAISALGEAPSATVATAPSAKPTHNRKYEEWKVKANYQDITDNIGTVIGRKLTGFEKDAQKCIKITNISEARAAELNSQSENTLTHLYLID